MAMQKLFIILIISMSLFNLRCHQRAHWNASDLASPDRSNSQYSFTDSKKSGTEKNPSSENSNCSPAKIEKLLATATAKEPSIELDCSVKIPREADGSRPKITKMIIMSGSKASGLTLDCDGAILESNTANEETMILIRSVKTVNSAIQKVTWNRPENIVVKNCMILGAARLIGIWPTDKDSWNKSSKQDQQHTERAQQAAPKNISFLNIDLVPKNSIPLYITPGVTNFRLENSRLAGVSPSVAIYLDAESRGNVIKNNYIATDTQRELLAIDGSAYNKIIGNLFSHLEDGGIYLYRNCGEDGVIRHQIPKSNHILNNTFYYNKYDGGNPSIWLASRNGNRRYCDDDDGYPWGSSSDNRDHAIKNVVMENQIYKLSPTKMIREDASPNSVSQNIIVTNRIERKLGCFIDGEGIYLKHQQYLPAFTSTGKVDCRQPIRKCMDGEFISQTLDKTKCESFEMINFTCREDGTNNGCAKWAQCPAGKKAVAVRAACNLEFGPVLTQQVQGTAWNSVKVVQSSDHTDEGHCRVDNVTISLGVNSVGVFGASRVPIGCWEHDKNGGDCEIAGQMLCGK
jgi:hypothetical protein